MGARRIPKIGQKISHYTITEDLGEGGMGVVFKATDERLDRFVALKFLPLEYVHDETAKSRFINEAKTASALDHRNICTIHEIDQTEDGLMYIVMGFYDGENVLKWLKRDQPLPLSDVVRIIIQVADGLGAAHAHGIIHRDIKPANLLIDNNGHVRIVDFGIAKLLGGKKITRTGLTPGTLDYMSPEQARGEEIDPRSDVFSVGTLFYVLVTAELPFPGDRETVVGYKLQNVDPTPPHELRSEVPTTMSEVIARAMKKHKDDRYQSMADLIADLRTL